MKPTPNHNSFLFWLHIVLICLNSSMLIYSLAQHRPLVALLSFFAISCFLFAGMNNFQKFFTYRKEMKIYNIEQKNLELQRLEAAFTAEMKAKKENEIKEKFSYF